MLCQFLCMLLAYQEEVFQMFIHGKMLPDSDRLRSCRVCRMKGIRRCTVHADVHSLYSFFLVGSLASIKSTKSDCLKNFVGVE